MSDVQLEELLKEHSKYFARTDDGKVRCECNGHQFPARYDVIAAFVKGSKFATLRKRYDAENQLGKYEPFIVQSKNFPTMLYCTLTGQLMDKNVEKVKVHMKGKKFQRNKELFAADKKELQPEPDLDTIMAEVMGRKASTKGKAADGPDAEEGEGEEEGEEGEEGETGEGSDDEDVIMDDVLGSEEGDGDEEEGDGGEEEASGSGGEKEEEQGVVGRGGKAVAGGKLLNGKGGEEQAKGKGGKGSKQQQGKSDVKESGENVAVGKRAGRKGAAAVAAGIDQELSNGKAKASQSGQKRKAPAAPTPVVTEGGVAGKAAKVALEGAQAGKGKQAAGKAAAAAAQAKGTAKGGKKTATAAVKGAAKGGEGDSDFEFSDVEEEAGQGEQQEVQDGGKALKAQKLSVKTEQGKKAGAAAGQAVAGQEAQPKRNVSRPSKSKKAKRDA